MQDIQSWLAELGLEKYGPAFAEAEIQFSDLVDLTEEDLKEVGLPVGPRRRASSAIRAMAENDMPAAIGIANDSTEEPQHQEQLDTSSNAERRHLTVMFVDLVGSTEMATRFDAEDMRNVITGYQNTVAGVVSRYEGFVAKFMGDGVMCYFGWPRAGEDDAERAVRAGLAIINSVRTTTAPDGTALATRIGVATGVVIVGDLIGSGATQEAAVVGETPNLAARLQGVAGPNQLVLPSETRRLLGSTYKLTSIGAQELKGVGTPVEAFVVEGEAVQESRFAARQSGTLTPIVGRDREIELMLERWALARSGQGQMVIVSGEAGIGKSRITRAVIDEVAKNDHTRITYQCSPYHADSAFYPVIQQFSFAAGFTSADGLDTRLDKLEALLGQDPETLKLITPMMGLDGTARYGALDLTPTQQRAHTMKTLAKLLVQQSQDRPVLLVYEDLHWIDPTSLELLDLLLDTVADQKIMILATARPSFEYGFGGHPIVTRFALNRLGKDQIGDIVAKLTGGKALPDEIMAIIAQRTDGVPLFVEELTKTILESGALKEDGDRLVLDGPLSTIAIPTTLHDSLMARLDRLQPIKEVAQTAACIGREFSHGLLAQISLLPEAELTEALGGLIAAELIYRRGLPPEATYLFKHALVRDAAYESQLKDTRRAIHARILSSLEADPDIAPEVLATHAEAANLTDRAIDLWEAAGKAAIARPAFKEGISNLRHAVDLINPNVEGGNRPLIERALALQVQLGFACLQGLGYAADETKTAMERALVLADMIGDTPLRFDVVFALWTGRYVRAEHAEALSWSKVLLDVAEASGDSIEIVLANRSRAVYSVMSGSLAEAETFLDKSLAAYDPARHDGIASRFGQEIGVTTHIYHSFNAVLLGDTGRAARHAQEAENRALASGHTITICYMHGHLIICAIIANDEPALAYHLNALKPIVEEHNLHIWLIIARIAADLLRAGRGDPAGIDGFFDLDAEMVAGKNGVWLPTLRIEAGKRALALGLDSQAKELATMAEEVIDRTGERFSLPDLHRLWAALANVDCNQEAAEKHLVAALDVARQQGSKLWELRAAIDLARLMQEQGRIDEANALLIPVNTSIADDDCPADQMTARKLLAALAN
ncbi:adenylate/guanylate cyclase domain-containing protein [Sulfitobacter sp. SK011]|uniref:AAA family ATPase n=1 Tax=Sulfitobacter sp. SK011 TaxID=1389004 RepID=UPI000E0B9F82|nr:adenylate/guanylate cyclase domain-containing protein [Sulfitobacter sp. SK011]AXI43257.1 adenylate cyclase [Sulfitobacter sp. SK011]